MKLNMEDRTLQIHTTLISLMHTAFQFGPTLCKVASFNLHKTVRTATASRTNIQDTFDVQDFASNTAGFVFHL